MIRTQRTKRSPREKLADDTRLPDAIESLKLRSPRQYMKYFCYVCHREWIGYPNGIHDRKDPSRSHPYRCNYEDCKSTVWHNASRALKARDRWLTKQKQRTMIA